MASAGEGDTIVVPAGEAVWTGALTIGKTVTLRGAGIDKTTITCRVAFPSAAIIISRNVHWVRITGFTFNGGVWSDNNLAIRVSDYNQNDGCHDFRIDHNKFKDFRWTAVTSTSNWVIRMFGYCYGVIDHNQFYDCHGEVIDYAADGTEAFARSTELGQYENGTVFVEDNDFYLSTRVSGVYAGNTIDMNSGARVVFRHNMIRDSPDHRWANPFDTHGFAVCANECSPNDIRGTLSYEIYENTFTTKRGAGEWNWGINLRGGKGVVFNNTFTGLYSILVRLTNERSYAYAQTATNTISLPYPRYEKQAHIDTDDGGPLINEGLVDGVLVFGQCQDQIQELYLWNNTHNGIPIASGDVYVDDAGYQRQDIVEGRNYFVSPLAGYTPYPYPHPLTESLAVEAPSGLRIVDD